MDMKLLVATGTIGIGLGLPSSTQATSLFLFADTNPGSACQLSIPTIDTEVRPKASGYRNEGVQNAFVICGYSKQSLEYFGTLVIGLTSMDGVAHAVSCTAVTGLNGNESTPLIYSTVTITVTASGLQAGKTWNAASFGSAASTIPGAVEPSVTCLLPANVAIVYLTGAVNI